MRDSINVSRVVFYLVAAIILLGAAVRLGPLNREDLEGDELFSRSIALLPIRSALTAVQDDIVHPPLYYLVLKVGVLMWGASPLGIRLPSLIFGLATLALVSGFGGTALRARNAGLLAGAMLALNQTMIFFSQQARSYALYTFLALLLFCWVSILAGRKEEDSSILFWGCGWLIMLALVYTHYMGALYVLSAFIAILTSTATKRTKLVLFFLSFTVAASLVPWLFAVVGPYHAKQGLGGNLSWLKPPELADLMQVWSLAVGPGNLRRGGGPALLIVAVLVASALILAPQVHRIRQSVPILVLALFATLPPITIFVLARSPFDLPIFTYRHVVPSIASLCLLCCYGLEALAKRMGRLQASAFAVGSFILMSATVFPTLSTYANGTLRYPWHIIAKDIAAQKRAGLQIFTGDVSMIGEPVNFYCEMKCVQPLPQDASLLPKTFIYLYQPNAYLGGKDYQDLLKSGVVEGDIARYGGGMGRAFETWMVHLSRP